MYLWSRKGEFSSFSGDYGFMRVVTFNLIVMIKPLEVLYRAWGLCRERAKNLLPGACSDKSQVDDLILSR